MSDAEGAVLVDPPFALGATFFIAPFLAVFFGGMAVERTQRRTQRNKGIFSAEPVLVGQSHNLKPR